MGEAMLIPSMTCQSVKPRAHGIHLQADFQSSWIRRFPSHPPDSLPSPQRRKTCEECSGMSVAMLVSDLRVEMAGLLKKHPCYNGSPKLPSDYLKSFESKYS